MIDTDTLERALDAYGAALLAGEDADDARAKCLTTIGSMVKPNAPGAVVGSRYVAQSCASETTGAAYFTITDPARATVLLVDDFAALAALHETVYALYATACPPTEPCKGKLTRGKKKAA